MLHMNLQHEFAWESATLDFETGALRALGESISFVELHGKHLWKFIGRLKKIELQTRAILELQLSGENVSNRRLCQRRKENKICRVVCGYNQGLYPDDLSYVKALAYLQADFLEHGEDN